MQAQTLESGRHERTERRIAWLTLALGGMAGASVAAIYSWRWGLGLLVGAALAWLNFRWLQGALDALKLLSIARPDSPKPQVPLSTWVRFVGRYALIGICLYAIFIGFNVPILSMLAGLCALGAAALAASVYEILHPVP
ncbi:MAG TPA: ATP synthase subunit I [Candidatus Acidoferrales bacterium]